MENLEFVVELDRFLQNAHDVTSPQLLSDSAIMENDRLLHQWRVMHKVFLQDDAIKEINIPYLIRQDLHGEILPSEKQLCHIRGLIYELLLDSFNEFVNHTREMNNDRSTRRRRLEIVPPEFKTSLPTSDKNCAVVFENVPRSLFPHASEHKPAELRAHWDKALEQFEQNKELVGVSVHVLSRTELNVDLPRSRTALSGTISTRASSRGSSIGSIVDNIKDYSGWKTMKKLRFRRSSNDHDME